MNAEPAPSCGETGAAAGGVRPRYLATYKVGADQAEFLAAYPELRDHADVEGDFLSLTSDGVDVAKGFDDRRDGHIDAGNVLWLGGTDHEPTWVCAAYGAEGQNIGAICFFAQLHVRTCDTEHTCEEQLAAQRVRIWERIKEAAARADPILGVMALEFRSPDELLGGPASRE